jgi:class 3 adenylate cyclase
VRQFLTFSQLAVSPAAAHAFFRIYYETDVRDAVATIRVPTLVIGRGRKDLARDLAARIPDARLILLPGEDVKIWLDTTVADEVEAFLDEGRATRVPDTVLATLLFTDVVASTERAAELGDRKWRELLERHHALVRRELARHRGEERDTAGDGFFATFDGPARAIRCAQAVIAGVGELGLELRAGVHTGECELHDTKVAGIAVSIGARVAALAMPGEVLVSRTVKDLVAGSGLEFTDRGTHALKGVPGEWVLYAVDS